MQAEVHNGHELEFTVFHDCALPPDDFVANCRIQFEDLKIGANNDIWVKKRRKTIFINSFNWSPLINWKGTNQIIFFSRLI